MLMVEADGAGENESVHLRRVKCFCKMTLAGPETGKFGDKVDDGDSHAPFAHGAALRKSAD